MRAAQALILILICFACSSEKAETNASSKNDYSVFYRELNTKNSWVIGADGIVFDKTEILFLDSSGCGYQFMDTARAYNINAIYDRRSDQLNNCGNALSLKNAGFNKLAKKQLLNNESYFVMSADSNLIFVYRILNDSANYSYTCELYGSHSADSTNSHYGFHKKESEVFTFRKYK
jgi:hypothetical protein